MFCDQFDGRTGSFFAYSPMIYRASPGCRATNSMSCDLKNEIEVRSWPRSSATPSYYSPRKYLVTLGPRSSDLASRQIFPPSSHSITRRFVPHRLVILCSSSPYSSWQSLVPRLYHSSYPSSRTICPKYSGFRSSIPHNWSKLCSIRVHLLNFRSSGLSYHRDFNFLSLISYDFDIFRSRGDISPRKWGPQFNLAQIWGFEVPNLIFLKFDMNFSNPLKFGVFFGYGESQNNHFWGFFL